VGFINLPERDPWRALPVWDWPHLRAIALRETQRTLGRTAAADDAAQETILRAWRHTAACHTVDRPEAWLRTIARREALRVLTRTPATEPLGDDDPDGSDHADEVADRVDVTRALRRLSGRERDVVLRHYWQDMSCEQIAHELACPLGTIKVRLHRARKKLGAALDGPVA
jgi:RNA polymerase sigma-70 factor (ECF subfamily)